jgi:AbrB family looped-hinge helix DNA binding protein
MKATGIVRRIDDLGRVVIPKEIRRNFHIREGDPMEIYMSEDGQYVCFKKYMVTEEPNIKTILKALYESAGAEFGRDAVALYNENDERMFANRGNNPSFPKCLETSAHKFDGHYVVPVLDQSQSIAYLIVPNDADRKLVRAMVRTAEYAIRNEED